MAAIGEEKEEEENGYADTVEEQRRRRDALHSEHSTMGLETFWRISKGGGGWTRRETTSQRGLYLTSCRGHILAGSTRVRRGPSSGFRVFRTKMTLPAT